MSIEHGALDERLREDEEYRTLEAEHHEYERRLLLFTEKVLLSDDERVEEITLKKKKLQLKDRMAAIARRIRQGVAYP
jgi:hypothetical protein